MVYDLVNQFYHLVMGAGAFLDNLFDSAAENAPVFIGQVLGCQHDDRDILPFSVGAHIQFCNQQDSFLVF